MQLSEFADLTQEQIKLAVSMLPKNEQLLMLDLLNQKKVLDCRDNFYTFCQHMDASFFTKGKPHLKLIADALQDVADGKCKELAISLPPRAGKSYIVSLWCAWVHGREILKGNKPSIMRNSYAATLAEKFSKDIRDGIIGSEKYKEIFPNIGINKGMGGVDAWALTGCTQPSYFCAGVGGSITGMGCRTAGILDDPLKNIEEALSENTIENVWNWYTSTHLSRFETGCPEIHIATRWSRNDVIGRLTDPDSEYYKPNMRVIVIPAMDDDGNSFCEEVKTTAEYEEIRRITDDFIWEAEFMQHPVESKGLLFPIEELNRFTMAELGDKKPDGIVGFTDTADEGTDFLCSIVGRRYGDKTYITDVVFTQDGVEITEPLVARMLIDTKCDMMQIESNNGGKGFARNVKQLADPFWKCTILGEMQTRNKETRILMNSGYIKEYFYFRKDYKVGSDYDKFMRAFTSYIKMGKNKHDDAPDAVTGLAEWIKLRPVRNTEQQQKPNRYTHFVFDNDDDSHTMLGGAPTDDYIKFIGE